MKSTIGFTGVNSVIREVQTQCEYEYEYEFSTVQPIYAYWEGITVKTRSRRTVQYDFRNKSPTKQSEFGIDNIGQNKCAVHKQLPR